MKYDENIKQAFLVSGKFRLANLKCVNWMVFIFLLSFLFFELHYAMNSEFLKFFR